ncbi:MAG TPA: M43 family zinc metalloprotease [Polyangia bacterium]|nr:M43 family zinc metalloprotease [Polyangia bacterium]
MKHTTLAAACLLLCAAPAPGWAYVRGVNDQQRPLFWDTSCELLTVYPNGWTGLDETTIATSVAAAAAAWGSTVTCPASANAPAGPPSFEVVVSLAPPGAQGVAALDYKNSVVFVQSDWEADSMALALTTRSVDSAGRLIDRDIEINAARADVLWAALDPQAPISASNGREIYDLQTVLTHELGHFIGLAHTCFGGGSATDATSDMPTEPVDDQGRPVPLCDDREATDNPDAYASVMWYTVTPSSAAKRSLTPDDVRAVCALYPPSSAAACSLNQPSDGCSCDDAGGGAAAGETILLLGFGVALTRRRRRRDRAPWAMSWTSTPYRLPVSNRRPSPPRSPG